jgi:hypothetical protein
MSHQTEILVGPRERASADETVVSLLRMLYVTQIYSAETFAFMLETFSGLTPQQRRKFEACRRLEAAIGRLLFEHLTLDLGQSFRPPSRARRAAETLAPPAYGTWFDYMTEIEAASIRGVQGARTLMGLYRAGAPRLCATLLASRMALRDFARDELDDLSDVSLDRILALLDDDDRRAVAEFPG